VRALTQPERELLEMILAGPSGDPIPIHGEQRYTLHALMKTGRLTLNRELKEIYVNKYGKLALRIQKEVGHLL
jgi:hypothetical protein